MNEELFDVVFFGILQPGKDKEIVMQNMAKMFKTDAAKLAPYFAGGRKVIKGNINAATAEKYRAALDNIGLVIKLEACQVSPAEESATAEASVDTGDMSVAPVGSDVIEHPVEKPAQKIDDISSITMAEAGADVIENPQPVMPQKIDDISDISMAEVGVDVLEHPQPVIPQKIEDISNLSLAEAGADIIENPKPQEKAKIPDTSELSLSNEVEKS